MSGELVVVDLMRRALGYESRKTPEAIDWAKVKELSLRHRVAPLVSAVPLESIPGDLCSWAHSVAISSVQRSIQMKRTLARVRERFDSAGVRALLFKGVALQEWAYGGLVRASADMDLLVEPCRVIAAAEELYGLGFRKIKSNGVLADPADSIGLWQDRSGNSIDLHVKAIEPYVYSFPDFLELWEQRIEISSLALPIFGPVHHMLLLFLHGSKHQWCRLSWIVDVAVVSRKLQESEIVQVCQSSEKMQSRRAVAVGALLCDEILGLPKTWRDVSMLPDACPRVKNIVKMYRKRLFVPLPNTSWIKLANVILHLQTFEKIGHKACYILARLYHAIGRQGASRLIEKT